MNLDSLLAKLAASYEQPNLQPEIVREIAANGKKPTMRKLRDNAPCTIAPSKPVAPLHVAGTLDAKGYTIATLKAGMRLSEPNEQGTRVPYCDPREIRNDKIRAIAEYVGFKPLPARRYDENGKTPIQVEPTFGEQEMLASMRAEREIHQRPIAPPQPRRIPLSVKGYVAGMPDELRKRVLDLKGRELLATEAEAEHVKLAKEATHEQIRAEHEGLALLERERRQQIQADLRALGAL